ncbi:MAG: COX15/CtaA family protein, partial [Vicingaceae bacterium]
MLKNNPHKPVIIWLLTGCVLIFLMVVIGGITRLTNSGLSMVDWKLIMGAIPPLNEQDWIATFNKYKQFPEYKEVNFHFTLQEFKAIFFWEYLHRL